MEFKLENLVRENLRNLKPYTSASDSQNFEDLFFRSQRESFPVGSIEYPRFYTKKY